MHKDYKRFHCSSFRSLTSFDVILFLRTYSLQVQSVTVALDHTQ